MCRVYYFQGLSVLSHLSLDFSYQDEGQGEEASKEAGKLLHGPKTGNHGAVFSLVIGCRNLP